MSAIAGIARPHGQAPEPHTVPRMLDAVSHRGGDGVAVWTGATAALGHRARFVTAEDRAERWPVVSADGAVRLVADVRLDNREELASALGLARHSRGFHTDGELLLAAYCRWGEEAPARLDGDFSLAVWDGRLERLFLARDHFGARPLFYHLDAAGSLYFGSEMKALFAGTPIPREPDDLAVANHFCAPVTDQGERTFYRDIRALPPAHSMVFDAGGVRLECYWSLDDERELRLPSDADYAAAFREHLERAVRVRLRSEQDVGITLSGGLDSSSLASLAGMLLPGRIHSFSAVFPEVSSADERRYQRSVVQRWSLRHAEYAADAGSPLADHRDIVRHIDGWQTAGNLRLNWNLYRLAAGTGANVMLEGFDGDTVVSHGTGYFGELAQQRAWLRLTLEAGALARSRGMPAFATAWSWISSFGVYPWLRRRGLYSRWRRVEGLVQGLTRRGAAPLVEPAPWQTLLRPEFIERIEQGTQLGMVSTERAHHCRALLRSINSHTTEVLNACGAAHGLDVRFPFFDRQLVEFCVSLPPQQKIRRGMTRLVLRRGMKGIVPDLVLRRPDKTNLEPAVAHTLRTYEAERIRRLPLDGSLEAIADYVNVDACREIYRRYEQGSDSEMDRLVVWLTLTFVLWLEESGSPS